MSLIKWNKNNQLSSPYESMFDNFWGEELWNRVATGTTIPAVNVKELNNQFEVQVASPGLKKEDFHIDLDNNVLTISAETKNEKEEKDGEKITRREFSYSSFRRSFTIPENIDSTKINATYNDGILMLTLPKKEKKELESKTKIAIS